MAAIFRLGRGISPNSRSRVNYEYLKVTPAIAVFAISSVIRLSSS